jgi:hypothetical protein
MKDMYMILMDNEVSGRLICLDKSRHERPDATITSTLLEGRHSVADMLGALLIEAVLAASDPCGTAVQQVHCCLITLKESMGVSSLFSPEFTSIWMDRLRKYFRWEFQLVIQGSDMEHNGLSLGFNSSEITQIHA